jgi:hypothetical protein
MRNALVVGGLVVVALIAGLVYMLAKDDAQTAQTSSGSGTAVVVEAPGTGGQPTVTGGTTGDRPALPAPPPGQNPRDYVVGDVRVRDHRSGDNKPLDVPPTAHPAEGRLLPSTLTHEVSQKLKAVMRECVASLPKDARGDKPRLEGQVVLAIKDKKLTVTKSLMQLRDVSGESVEPTKQCIEAKALGVENPAADQADLDNYAFNISFAIP